MVGILATAAILYAGYREQLQYWHQRLTRVADANQQLVQAWLEEREGDAQELASLPAVRAAVAGATAAHLAEANSANTRLQSILDVFVATVGYEAIYVLDDQGNPRAQSGTSLPLPTTFAEACQTTKTRRVITLLMGDQMDSRPRVAILSPIREWSGGDGNRPARGCVVLLNRAGSIAFVLLRGDAASSTGETVLAALEGSSPIYISPLRNWDPAKPPPQVSSSTPMHVAVVKRRAVFGQYLDYRGVPVLAITRFLPGPEWGMVTKVDRAEALRPFYATVVRSVFMTLLFIVVLVSVASALWRRQRIEHLQADLANRKRTEGELRRHAKEREAIEEQLRISEERFRLAFTAGKVGFWDWDMLTGGQVWSGTAMRQLGLPEDAPANFETWMSAIHPDDRQTIRDAIDRAFSEKTAYSIEFRTVWPDGSVHHLMARGRAFYGETGHPVRMTGITIDVDDVKLAEEHLQLQVAALQAAANAIVITDRKGTIVWTNDAFSRLTGYAPEEALGQTPRLLKSGKMSSQFYAELWSTISSGKTWRGEVVNRRKNGSLYTEEMTVTPVRSSEGEINHFVAIKQDITERKLLESQFMQAQKMEAVGRLAGGIAHDFNNALSVITGYSEVLQLDLSSGDPKRLKLEEIQKAGQRAASLTRQLLAFSRKQTIQPVVLNLNTVISDTQKMLHHLIGEDIVLTFKPECVGASVKADRSQVEQILMNLAVNARDAMPRGGELNIKVTSTDLDEGYLHQGHSYAKAGRYVVLTVSDNGSGMDKETQAHIFEPFFTTKDPAKGTGLGLSTVYGIVKQSNGHICVYSEPGLGTTFRIYLPEVEPVSEPVSAPGAQHALPFGTETVLLVEDEDALRQLASRCLQRGGYSVLEAHDGETAIAMANQYQKPIDLLLSDVIMPGLSGRDLADQLLRTRPGMKLLYMSGYSDDLIAHQGVLDQGTTMLEKPFSLESLLVKVREVLDRKAQSASAP